MGFSATYEEMRDEYDLRYIWECPNGCGYEYEAQAQCNEEMPCPECGCKTVKAGESYSCKGR